MVMNTALITACLAIMGKGMLGIFAVILVIGKQGDTAPRR